jgi:hypothetical protein
MLQGAGARLIQEAKSNVTRSRGKVVDLARWNLAGFRDNLPLRIPTVRRVGEVYFVWMLESPVATGVGSAPHEARYGSHEGDMPNRTVLVPS